MLVLALKEILLEDPTVTALTGQNIYDYELPLEIDDTMTVKAVVITPAGGPGRFNNLAIHDQRITIRSYAETGSLAAQVDKAVFMCFKNMTPRTRNNTFVHWCNPSVAGISLRDPALEWSYSVSSYVVRSADNDVS